MKEIEYEELKKIARNVKTAMIAQGQWPFKKVRRKPRDGMKRAILLQRALARVQRYKPQKKGDKLILPFFND